MSAKDHSITNSKTTKQLNMPLKASVVLVSAMLMAACGTNGKQSYNLEDVFGSSDIVYKPKKPTAANFSEDGTKISGQAEAGAIIKIKDEAGNVIGSTEADDKGNFEFSLDTPLTDGQKVKVEAYYPNGTRPSDPLESTAPNIKDPTEPTEPTDPTEPNQPEADKSGVQSLNINAGSLGVFNKTTRDFTVNEDGSVIEARADLASQNPQTPDKPGLLPKVDITTSAEGDTELDNGFKDHKDNTEITVAALGQTLPLAYTSTYKDFGDDMRIGHIHGGAEVALLGTTLPVDGVAVIGNATKAENIPTEGTVGYTGDATYRKLGLDNEIEYGSSAFTADFVAKEVSGELEFANAGNIGLKADIEGNKFSGTAEANNGYTTDGGFYGGDAQYLGGVYQGNGAQGTYGAMQDEAPAEPNQPEASKSGAQSLNVNAGSLGVFNKTTRDFTVNEDGSVIEARADLASQNPQTPDKPGLLPKVNVITSAAGDAELDNGFKEHKDNTEITVAALGQTLPLAYSSVYKDFGDYMRIGHIHGGAEVALLSTTLPVDGVTIVGNATKVENMPTEGMISYSGDATYRELGLDKSIEFGSSAFTADFVAKNLEGQLSFAKAGDIDLNAGIDGNKFSGAADANGGYNTEGGFYGGDAQYLGGIYQGNGAQGTFGAEMELPE